MLSLAHRLNYCDKEELQKKFDIRYSTFEKRTISCKELIRRQSVFVTGAGELRMQAACRPEQCRAFYQTVAPPPQTFFCK